MLGSEQKAAIERVRDPAGGGGRGSRGGDIGGWCKPSERPEGGFSGSVRDAGSRTPHTRMNLQERLAARPSGEPRNAVRRNAWFGEGTKVSAAGRNLQSSRMTRSSGRLPRVRRHIRAGLQQTDSPQGPRPVTVEGRRGRGKDQRPSTLLQRERVHGNVEDATNRPWRTGESSRMAVIERTQV